MIQLTSDAEGIQTLVGLMMIRPGAGGGSTSPTPGSSFVTIKPLGVTSKLTGSRALSSGAGCACLSEAGCIQGRLPSTAVLGEEQAFVSAPSTASFLLKSGCH